MGLSSKPSCGLFGGTADFTGATAGNSRLVLVESSDDAVGAVSVINASGAVGGAPTSTIKFQTTR